MGRVRDWGRELRGQGMEYGPGGGTELSRMPDFSHD